jgi:hypothetical protein
MQSSPINISTSGANTLVAAQPGRRVRVLGYLLSGAGPVNLQFLDGASNNLSGLLVIASTERLRQVGALS